MGAALCSSNNVLHSPLPSPAPLRKQPSEASVSVSEEQPAGKNDAFDGTGSSLVGEEESAEPNAQEEGKQSELFDDWDADGDDDDDGRRTMKPVEDTVSGRSDLVSECVGHQAAIGER